jgi:hypothetical protein
MARRQAERILVIKLSALGDFVLALAAMKKIRQAHPKAHISLLTTPPFEGLAKASPYFNAVFTDGRPEGPPPPPSPRPTTRASTTCRPRPIPTASSRSCGPIRRPGRGSRSAARCRTAIPCATACTPSSARPTS